MRCRDSRSIVTAVTEQSSVARCRAASSFSSLSTFSLGSDEAELILNLGRLEPELEFVLENSSVPPPVRGAAAIL